MAARKVTRKTVKKSVKSVSKSPKKVVAKKSAKAKVTREKSINLEVSNEKWYDKYSFTTWEFTRRFILFLVLVYVALTYRGVLIAATVNGEPISRISVITDLEKQGGKDALDTLINEVLIKQKAREALVDVTQADIDAKISEIETNYVTEGQSLDDLLALQGMTREILVNQLKTQIMVEKLLEGDVTVSDEDVKAFLEENKEFLPAESTEQQLNDLAREQLRQQKLSQRFTSWIEELRSEASINRYVNY